MPSGIAHTKMTCAAMSVGIGASVLAIANGDRDLFEISVYATAGVARTLIINPDLDVDGGNITHQILRETIPPLERIWGIWRTPYSESVKHRSVISHGFVISTAIRCLYSIFPPSILLIADQESKRPARYIVPVTALSIFSIIQLVVMFNISLWFPLWFFLGASISDSVHIAADIAYSWSRKVMK